MQGITCNLDEGSPKKFNSIEGPNRKANRRNLTQIEIQGSQNDFVDPKSTYLQGFEENLTNR
jgi:hypothetical protein